MTDPTPIDDGGPSGSDPTSKYLSLIRVKCAQYQNANNVPDAELHALVNMILRFACDAQAHYLGFRRCALEALKEISEGKGRFSPSKLQHATNTIEDMKGLAIGALVECKQFEASLETKLETRKEKPDE